MKILGLDVGEKRIGVARADSSTRIAVPVGFIEADGSEWQKIADLCKMHNTFFFVVGLPRSNEGTETAQSAYVRGFAKTLVEKIPEARVRFQDESLTSVVAEERLKSRRRTYGKGEIDAEAAAIILQDFMESFKQPTDKSPESPSSETLAPARRPEVVRVPRGGRHGGRCAPFAPVVAQASSEGNSENLQNGIKAISKKEANKMKLKAKKTKHKMGVVAKSVSIITVLLIIGALAAGGFFWYKHNHDLEMEAYWAAREAEINENSVFSFTIRPGETIYEIRDALVEVGYDATEVNEALAADYDFAFLQGRPEGATLEGYLFGETYEFYKTDSVKDILTKYLTGMGKVIAENDLEAKYAEQGLSLYEGITLASVVQSEAGRLEDDMPTVAQVFFTRLAYGIPLGSDVTVSYALDTVDPDRQTYVDNQAALRVDSCYNTRFTAGLPCGPISNPGLAALLAVAEPSDTAYFYFLTGDDGLMYYSYTEAEHNQKAAIYCQDLCNISL